MVLRHLPTCIILFNVYDIAIGNNTGLTTKEGTAYPSTGGTDES